MLAVALLSCHRDRQSAAVVLASGADLQSMNSVITTHPLARQVQRYVLLTTLARYDSTLALEPYLARSWAWSADSAELTFQLHMGVGWHDGRPTTARDVAFTLGLALDSTAGYPRRRDLADLREAVALDDSTVLLRFSARQRRFPDVLTDLAILPAHLLADVAPTEIRHARWNERPVGNGPFRFVRHDPNRRWVFEANPAFPPSLGGRPRLDRLVVAVVDEPMTKLAALTAGELDFAGIQPAHADFVRRDPDLAVVDYPLFFSYAVVFNARRPPFDRVEVRRALGLALDRTAIVSGYLFGFGEPAAGPRSPDALSGGPRPPLGPPGGDPRAPLGPPGGDPSAADAPGARGDAPIYAPGRARAILGDTLAFELVTVGSGEAALEQMIQQQLARINVKVTIRQLELATFLERVQTGHEFDAAVMGISGDREGGYLRSLLDLTGLPVPASGVDLFRYYADSVPVSFLYHARGVQGMNRRIDGVRMDLRGELPTVARWVAR